MRGEPLRPLRVKKLLQHLAQAKFPEHVRVEPLPILGQSGNLRNIDLLRRNASKVQIGMQNLLRRNGRILEHRAKSRPAAPAAQDSLRKISPCAIRKKQKIAYKGRRLRELGSITD